MIRADRVLGLALSPRAECLGDSETGTECDWHVPCSRRARDLAKMHTKATGHRTRVTRETFDEYEKGGTW